MQYSISQFQTSQMTTGWLFSLAVPLPPGVPETGLVAGFGGRDLLVRIHVPATGFDELFSLFVPDSPPSVPRPLLVGFHGFAVSHLDLAISTTFMDECRQRDWFMVAPFQFSAVGDAQTHYASAQSQEHVEAVIRWTMHRYNIDQDRVYGVGFSMGGGAALSYAARHRDPADGAIAAVVNHTGTASTGNVYANVNSAVQDQLELLFGGPPSASAFEYQRSSVVEIDSLGVLEAGGRHMAVNLEPVSVRTIYGTADPLNYLIDQSIVLDNFLESLPMADHELLPLPVPSICFQPGRFPHCWDTMPEDDTCDWLASKSLHQPQRGSLLADRGGRWESFELLQRNAGAFSRVDYLFEPSINRVILFSQENLAEIDFDLADGGLNASTPMDVAVRGIDANASRTVIRGFTAAPSSVERNSTIAVQSCLPPGLFPNWCYDATRGAVILNEPAADLAVWTINP